MYGAVIVAGYKEEHHHAMVKAFFSCLDAKKLNAGSVFTRDPETMKCKRLYDDYNEF